MAERLVPVWCEGLAGGDPKLLGDEIEARHRLRYGVLDLDPAVQLQKEERVAVEDELDRSRAAVGDCVAERHRCLVQRRAERGGDARRGSLLEHFLMAPLDGAVALAQGDDPTVRIGEELHLDMPGPLQVALAVQRAVAKGTLCLSLRRRERLVELGSGAHDAHAASAASRRGLDEEREADLLRRSVGQDGNARLARDPLRGELVSAEAKRLRRWTDPDETGGLDRLREVAVLREESVPGMDRVRARRLRGPDVLLRVQVRGDLDTLVGRTRVQRARVVGRHDGNRLDPELSARAEHAHRDLASIGDEQPLDRHRAHSRHRAGGNVPRDVLGSRSI